MIRRFHISEGLLHWSENSTSLDLRSLAVVRMAYGVLLLCDLGIRAAALEAHYCDSGVFPRSLYFSTGYPFVFCFHTLVGTVSFMTFLFVLNAIAAVCLCLGYRTKIATIVCWVFLLSLHNRNFMLLNAGDVWMRCTLFWAIFLPWGRLWSVDAKEFGTTNSEDGFRVTSVASVAYLIQVFLVYWMAGIFKHGPSWWEEGSATQLSLMLTEWNSGPAYYLLYFPALLKCLTYLTLVYEIVAPILLFSPVFTQQLRTLLVMGFVFFHLSLEFFMEIGIFPYVGVFTVLGLVTAWFWELKPGVYLQESLDRVWEKVPGRGGKGKPYLDPDSAPWNIILPLTLGYVLIWNLGTWDRRYEIPGRAQLPGYLFRFDQYWSLFAPEPPRFHNYYLAVATLADGRQVDLIRNNDGPVRWNFPKSSAAYENQRWKRFYVVQANETGRFCRPYFLAYLYRRHLQKHPDIRHLELWRLLQPSMLNFEEVPPEKISLGKMTRQEYESRWR